MQSSPHSSDAGPVDAKERWQRAVPLAQVMVPPSQASPMTHWQVPATEPTPLQTILPPQAKLSPVHHQPEQSVSRLLAGPRMAPEPQPEPQVAEQAAWLAAVGLPVAGIASRAAQQAESRVVSPLPPERSEWPNHGLPAVPACIRRESDLLVSRPAVRCSDWREPGWLWVSRWP